MVRRASVVSEQIRDEAVERGYVALHGRFELDAAALADDGDAVVAERAGGDHRVAGPDFRRREIDAFADGADAGGDEEKAVRRAALYDFRVAGTTSTRASAAVAATDWRTRSSTEIAGPPRSPATGSAPAVRRRRPRGR